MANTTYFGWETPDDTDLVKDGAAAIRTLGQAIDTSMQDLEGGTTGQILAKNSNADMDFVWVTNDVGDITEVVAGTGLSGGGSSGSVTLTNTVATEFDAKGDLVVGTGADTFDKLTVGANDTILVADSSTATGLKWAAPASGGGMTLINSGGTALSGTSTQISSIPDTYNDLIVYIVDFNCATNPSPCRVTINNDTTAANYQQYVNRGSGSSDGSYVDNATSGMDVTGYAAVAGDNNNFATVYFANYANTVSRKVANSMAGFQANTSPASRAVTNNTTAYNASTLKITSLEIRCPDSTGWAGGTVYVYGVK